MSPVAFGRWGNSFVFEEFAELLCNVWSCSAEAPRERASWKAVLCFIRSVACDVPVETECMLCSQWDVRCKLCPEV